MVQLCSVSTRSRGF